MAGSDSVVEWVPVVDAVEAVDDMEFRSAMPAYRSGNTIVTFGPDGGLVGTNASSCFSVPRGVPKVVLRARRGMTTWPSINGVGTFVADLLSYCGLVRAEHA